MDNLWKSFLDVARETFDQQDFDTWICPMSLGNIKDDTIILLAPNDFFKEWIVENYHAKILVIFTQLLKKDMKLVISISKKEAKKEIRTKTLNPTLMPKYTFDRFKVGPSNEFANAAAHAVVEKLGDQYNPLLIYSKVGLGKTHLMTAIGHEAYNRHPDKKILFYTTDSFTNEMISCIRLRKMDEFRDKFRSADLLLVDDIQFIAGRDSTQTEFFNIFNILFESKKQIILTSDRFPKQLNNIEDRLRNRFEWGLSVEINPPEYELCVAILKDKTLAHNLILPEEIASYIATNINKNIREMEGALIKILAYSSLNKQPLSLNLAKELLKEYISKENHVLTVDSIQRSVADFYNIKVSDLKSQKKIRSIVLPRQIAIYLCRKLTQLPLNEIGSKFGGKDHSTVIHSFNKISGLIETDETIKKQLSLITSSLTKC